MERVNELIGRATRLKEGSLTPKGEAATAGFFESTTWQSTPFPKMIRIITPKNSAAGSLMYSLEMDEHRGCS